MTIPSASNKSAENYVPEGKTVPTIKPLKSQAGTSEGTKKVDIIDIRHDAVEINLKEEILGSLRPQNGPKTLPTLLLYDERGLQLFEEVSDPMGRRVHPCINIRIDYISGRILPHERRD
jgi:hypothetical protein